MAGYSGTPLVKKIGIKENFNVAILNAPAEFLKTLHLPAGVKVNSRSPQPLDLAWLFVKTRRELETKFSLCAAKLAASGMLWISWPKKSSGVVSDLSDNVVRELGLGKGMVDVKVCAVDEVWSGLKFVFRLRDRPKLKKAR
jgi:hypothetical protein